MVKTTAEDTTLPLLADPSGYVACTWDLTKEPQKRAYWLALFRRHFPSLLEEALSDAEHRGEDRDDATRRAEAARRAFIDYLDALVIDPDHFGRLDILEICYTRERLLRRFGFDDPYRQAKARQTETALSVLPGLLADLDAMPADERAVAVIKGVFAGNIFDLGAPKTVARFQNKPVDFHATLRELKVRPWLVDDLDLWLARMQRGPAHRAAVLFVDNAGPDITLGMIPFARDLLQRGTRVILAANTIPSLNDVTHEELVALVARVAAMDPVIRAAQQDGRLRVVASGNGAPLIDLSRISPELAAAVKAESVDLVVLEGMGRALESNFHARFACEALKVAMIKDEGVAAALSGELYDLVLRYDPAG